MLKLVLLKIVLLRFRKVARRMAGVETLSTLDIRSLSNIGAQLFEYAHLECSVQFARLMCTSRLGVVYSYCSPLLTVLQRPSLRSLGVDIESAKEIVLFSALRRGCLGLVSHSGASMARR